MQQLASLMSDVVRFTNGYLAMPDGSAVQRDLYVSAKTGKIVSAVACNATPASRTVNLQGQLLSPGLIDVQINGAYDFDFAEYDPSEPGSEEKHIAGLKAVSRRLLETGCTSFVPTIMTVQSERYPELLRLLGPRSAPKAAHILGYHAEGPFLHPTRKGAHPGDLLMITDASQPLETIEAVYGAGALDQDGVKLITVAPEVEGVMDCIPELVKRGLTVCIGHSEVTLAEAFEAVHRGARMITHLYNCMRPMHHREPGIVGLLGDRHHKPYYGIIVDGHHVHPNAVALAYNASPEKCIVVTDAHATMDPHTSDGVRRWRPGVNIRKAGPVAYIDGTDTLAGSCAPLPFHLHNLIKFTGITLPQALLTMTLHPAQMLGGHIARTKGQLKEGFDADLCILDWQGNVRGTWIMGREAWRDDAFSPSLADADPTGSEMGAMEQCNP